MPLAQTLPQAPQLRSSLNLSTHSAPQGSSGASQAPRHLYVPARPQTGVGLAQEVAQSPQCSTVLNGGRQPGSPASPSSDEPSLASGPPPSGDSPPSCSALTSTSTSDDPPSAGASPRA